MIMRAHVTETKRRITFVCACKFVENDRIYNKVPPVKSLNTAQYATPDSTTPVPLSDELGRPRDEVRALILKADLGGDKLASFGTPGALLARALRAR